MPRPTWRWPNRIAGGVADFDLDGRDEVMVGSAGQNVLIDPAEGAGIGQWDLRASRVALASVLRRRPEAYHEKLRKMADAARKELVRHLVYDDHERRSGLVRILDPAGRQLGDFVNGEWRIESAEQSKAVLSRLAPGLFVRKTVSVGGDRLAGSLSVGVEVQNRGLGPLTGTLELEWNVNLLGGGGNEKAYYRWAGKDARFDTSGSVDAGVALSFGNEHEGVDVRTEIEPPTEQEWLSVDTVSNSESGFEKTHQGSCLTQRWKLGMGPSETQTFTTTFRFTQSRDRAAEELDSN